MAEWLLKRLTSPFQTYPIINADTFHIHKTLNGLNNIPTIVTTGTTGTFSSREYVAILNESSVEVFRGYTTSVDQDTNNATETYEIMEAALELGEILIEQTPGPDEANEYITLFTGITVAGRTGDILFGSGWTTGTVDVTVPSEDTRYNYQDVLTGVFSFLRDTMDNFVYFDSTTSKVHWFSTFRTDRSFSTTGINLTNAIYYNKRVLNGTYKQDIQKIVVVGNTSEIYGEYDSGASGKSIAFSYPEAKLNAECTTRATKIHQELTKDTRQQLLLILPTTIEYDEGDKVSIDGMTSNEEFIVYEVDRYIHKIEISCDNGYEAPAYQQKIRRADKVVDTVNDADISAGMDTVLGGAEGVEGQTFASGISEWFNSLLSQTTSANDGSIDHITLSNLNSSAYKHMVGGQDAIRYLTSDPITSTRTGELVINNTDLTMFFNKGTSGTPNWCQVNFTKDKLDSLNDPTANDDVNDGYSVGSVWMNVSADTSYICVDSTATLAVWAQISGGGGVTDHGALTGLGDNDHTQYVLDTGDTMTGNLSINKTDPALQLKTGGTIQGRMYTTSGDTVVLADIASGDLYLSTLAAGGGDIYIEPDSGELYTTATALTLDHNNAGAENETMIKFDRGTTDANDAAFVWHVTDDMFKCYSDVDAGTRILGNLKVGYILAQSGISLDGNTIASSKVKIEENDTTGDMEFTVQTNDSFVFKTVA